MRTKKAIRIAAAAGAVGAALRRFRPLRPDIAWLPIRGKMAREPGATSSCPYVPSPDLA